MAYSTDATDPVVPHYSPSWDDVWAVEWPQHHTDLSLRMAQVDWVYSLWEWVEIEVTLVR